MTILEKVKNGMLDALFPAICVGCGREGNYVCERCTLFLGEAESICPRCYRRITREVHSQCQKRNALDGLWRSGVTLNECASALKRAGIEKVWGLTLAKVA